MAKRKSPRASAKSKTSARKSAKAARKPAGRAAKKATRRANPATAKSKPVAAKKGQWVYSFGGGRAEGKANMRELLGGKGAGLAEMANLGLPVPPGFTITTD